MTSLAKKMKAGLQKKCLPPEREKYSFRMNADEFMFVSPIIEKWNSHGLRLIQFPKNLPSLGWVKLVTKTAWHAVNKVLALKSSGYSQEQIITSIDRFAVARDNLNFPPRNKQHLKRLCLGNFIFNDYYDFPEVSTFLRSQFEYWLTNEPQEGFKPSSILRPYYNSLKSEYEKRFLKEGQNLSERDLESIQTGAMRLMKSQTEWDECVAILPHLEIPGIPLYCKFMCNAIEWAAEQGKIFRNITPGAFKSKRLGDICVDYFKAIGKWIP